MPRDVSLSDNKCWNGGQRWVKNDNASPNGLQNPHSPKEYREATLKLPQSVDHIHYQIVRTGNTFKHNIYQMLDDQTEMKLVLKINTQVIKI